MRPLAVRVSWPLARMVCWLIQSDTTVRNISWPLSIRPLRLPANVWLPIFNVESDDIVPSWLFSVFRYAWANPAIVNCPWLNTFPCWLSRCCVVRLSAVLPNKVPSRLSIVDPWRVSASALSVACFADTPSMPCIVAWPSTYTPALSRLTAPARAFNVKVSLLSLSPCPSMAFALMIAFFVACTAPCKCMCCPALKVKSPPCGTSPSAVTPLAINPDSVWTMSLAVTTIFFLESMRPSCLNVLSLPSAISPCAWILPELFRSPPVLICKLVWLLITPALRMLSVALSVKFSLLSILPLLLTWPVVLTWRPAWLPIDPALVMRPFALTVILPWLTHVPVLTILPSVVRLKWPLLLPNSPALRTPTPFSVPTIWILPAYIPPSADTSSATSGFGLLSSANGVIVCALRLTLLRPVTTFKSLAHTAEFIDTERAIKSV